GEVRRGRSVVQESSRDKPDQAAPVGRDRPGAVCGRLAIRLAFSPGPAGAQPESRCRLAELRGGSGTGHGRRPRLSTALRPRRPGPPDALAGAPGCPGTADAPAAVAPQGDPRAGKTLQ